MINDELAQNNFHISYVNYFFRKDSYTYWKQSQITEGEKQSSWADKSPMILHYF